MKQVIILGLSMLLVANIAINKTLKQQNTNLQEQNLDLLFAYDDVQSELSEYKHLKKLITELGK